MAHLTPNSPFSFLLLTALASLIDTPFVFIQDLGYSAGLDFNLQELLRKYIIYAKEKAHPKLKQL